MTSLKDTGHGGFKGQKYPTLPAPLIMSSVVTTNFNKIENICISTDSLAFSNTFLFLFTFLLLAEGEGAYTWGTLESGIVGGPGLLTFRLICTANFLFRHPC